MAPAALGTDTGGSVRIPAGVCGIVGLKPTYGEVPIDGVVPLCQTLDHVGSFALTVTDVWLVHRALTGATEAPTLTPRALAGLRLGVPRAYFCEVIDAGVRARFDEALKRLEARGVQLHDVDIPHAHMTSAVYIHIHSTEAAVYHAKTLEATPERYTKTVRLRLEVGRFVMAEDYVRAMRGRELLRTEVDAALAGYDALILPTLPIPAPRIGEESVVVEGMTLPVRALMLRNTQLFNMTGHPAISLPNGVTSEGLPCGLELVGRHFDTHGLLEVARGCEEGIA
jgi:aspartyl-tRNA(Asn)/glutamyl-tRNA(Gln) amidotransferase subunit A